MAGGILKRLEALERSITFRRSRFIVYEAHDDTADSDHEAFLKEIAAGGADLASGLRFQVCYRACAAPELSASPLSEKGSPMSYPPDKPKGITVRTGETRHAGERPGHPKQDPGPGRNMHPGAKVTTSDTIRKGSHKVRD